MGATSIEWTDATWNPVRGCSRVSEGCRHCYAERVAARFSGSSASGIVDSAMRPVRRGEKGPPFAGFAYPTKAGPRWTGRVELIPSMLDAPLRWRKPRRIFVNSMSDLFHERLSDESIAAVFGVMAASPQHTFQVLTKRPERMRRWFEWVERDSGVDAAVDYDCFCAAVAVGRFRLPGWSPKPWPLPNVWLGTSVEDQATADERIPHLLATPAAVRFVSYEPALGPVDFTRYLPDPEIAGAEFERWLDWVIVGGESGPGARPFDLAWARSAVEQCKAAGVPVFVKQLGSWPFSMDGDFWPRTARFIDGSPQIGVRLRDRKGGDPSEWPEDLRVREFPRP